MPRIDPFAPARTPKPARPIAYDFVLERLAPLAPSTRPMFGSHGVYLDERVICILRKKGDTDDGVWICFEPEMEPEVMVLLPRLQRIDRLGNVRNWRKLAANDPSFEEDVLKACSLLLAGDTRIGKLPDRLKAKRNIHKPKTPVARSSARSKGAPAGAPAKAPPARKARGAKPPVSGGNKRAR